jgi:hypothetical protein
MSFSLQCSAVRAVPRKSRELDPDDHPVCRTVEDVWKARTLVPCGSLIVTHPRSRMAREAVSRPSFGSSHHHARDRGHPDSVMFLLARLRATLKACRMPGMPALVIPSDSRQSAAAASLSTLTNASRSSIVEGLAKWQSVAEVRYARGIADTRHALTPRRQGPINLDLAAVSALVTCPMQNEYVSSPARQRRCAVAIEQDQRRDCVSQESHGPGATDDPLPFCPRSALASAASRNLRQWSLSGCATCISRQGDV